MKTYAIINNNKVINVIIATDSFIPPDSTYVLTTEPVSVGDSYENGKFTGTDAGIVAAPIEPLTLEEIDAILAMLENENNN
jgi:hypothetical protein